MSCHRLFSNFVLFATVLSLVKGSSAPFYSSSQHGTGHQHGPSDQNSKTSIDIYRLNDEITPKSYTIRVIPDLQKFTYTGKVEISIRVKFTTNKITLHSRKLEIKTVQVLRTDRSQTPVTNSHELDVTNDLLIITTSNSQPLTFGTDYTVVIEFEGKIVEELEGFYRSLYEIEGKEYRIALTHFEPNNARQAFPCFDEPRFRTPFTIYLARHRTHIALSNMPSDGLLPDDRTLAADHVWEKFKTSPAMPTYLVSFMVSELVYTANNEVRVKLYARPNALSTEQGAYALQQSTKILQQLEGYFGIAYKLPKLDIVAVPDFQIGGMENWGMVTFKERVILTDKATATTSADQKHIITTLISHELSHQWFGNLVTPPWYNYLWLKEGFATYFETFIAAAIEPEWNLEQIFVIEVLQEALWKETTTQRAMTTSIRKSNQLNEIYDIISYEKAGSIIRMFEHMVSKPTFKNVIHTFLTNGEKINEGFVNQEDLFNAFQTETQRSSNPIPSHTTISEILKTWTENIGFPLITVTRSYDTGEAKICQMSYRASSAPSQLPDQKWIVPLTYTTSSELKFSDTTPTAWSFAGQPTELKEKFSSTDWVLFNLQQTGYYRVNYDTKNWDLLIKQLQEDHEKIPVLNRAQLISDAYTLAFDGHLTYRVPIELTKYLSKETEWIPWYAAIKAFNVLRVKLSSTTEETFFKKYLYDLVKQSYEKFGFEIKSSDSHVAKIAKPHFLKIACNLDIEDCVQKASTEYKNNEADLTKVQPDAKRVVFCHALRKSTDQQTVFNKLWETYTKYDISYEKQRILTALTCATDEEIIKKVLSIMIDPKNKEIRKQDRSYFLDWIPLRPTAITASLKFIGEKVATISELNEDGIKVLKNILDLVESFIQTQDQIQQLKDLETKFSSLDQTKYGEFTSKIQNLQLTSADTIKSNIQKLDRVGKEFSQTSDTKTDTNRGTNTDTKETTAKPTETPNSGAMICVPELGWRLLIAATVLCYSLSRVKVS